MKKLSTLFILIIIGSSMISCYPTKQSTLRNNPEIKNVILMICDGIGLPDIFHKILAAYGFQ